MDQSWTGVGLLTVFAVSGSVAFISRLFHKRLVADYLKKIELEFSASGRLCQVKKKKVRFADDLTERMQGSDRLMRKAEDESNDRQVLEYRTLMKRP